MKINWLFLFLFIGTLTFAQRVEQQSTTMSLGSQNAYYISVEGANKDILEDAWKEYTKEFGKAKQNKKAKESTLEKAKIALINGTSPVTLYSKIEEGKNEGTVFIWVDLGGSFANGADHKSQSAGIETFLKDFWVVARKKAVSKELEMEEKKAKELAKELTKLEEKKKDYQNEIEKCKLKIAEAEKNIEINNGTQKTKKQEIDSQKRTVQMVVDKLNAVGKSMN